MMALPATRRGAVATSVWRSGLLQAGPLALAGLAANGGSVLVTLVLARLLVAREYGGLNQLIGVFFVVSTPGAAVLVGVVRRVTRWPGDAGDVGHWGAALHRRATGALVAFAVVVIAAGPAIADLLGRHDAAGFDAMAVAGALWVLLCVDRGLLQAHREYRTLSANLFVEAGARTALMLVAGAAGLGVDGVAVGVLLAEACTAIHARFVARRAWRTEGSHDAPRRWAPSWRSAGRFGRDPVVRRDLVAAVAALGAIALLQYVDVIVMGRAAPRVAGAYAAVSVSSKALVFVAVVVGGYLLPEAAISWRDGTHALRQLAVSLAILAVPAVALVTVAGVAPRQFLDAAFSGRYVSASGAFLPLAFAMVCLGATVLLTMYLLGVGDRRFAAVLVGAAAFATAAVVLAGGSPLATALGDLGVQATLLCASAAELARVHRRRPSGRSGG